VAQEKSQPREVLRRFDLVLFTACAIVGPDSVAAASQAVAQAIAWLAISLVIFLIPYRMLVGRASAVRARSTCSSSSSADSGSEADSSHRSIRAASEGRSSARLPGGSA